MKSKSKYYVVWVGAAPGVYDTWAKCQAQIMGFPNAKYKSFKTKVAATTALKDGAAKHIVKKSAGTGSKSTKSTPKVLDKSILKNSISVDAACSGNPGLMEYRGVETFSKNELFHVGPYKNGTNNIGEFLALVHGLAFLKKEKMSDVAIYSDSRTAMSWVRNKKVKTTLKRDHSNESMFDHVDRALFWLDNNSVPNKIIKWDTKNWGEIPADFGRK